MQRLDVNVGLHHRDTSSALSAYGCCYSSQIHQNAKANLQDRPVRQISGTAKLNSQLAMPDTNSAQQFTLRMALSLKSLCSRFLQAGAPTAWKSCGTRQV